MMESLVGEDENESYLGHSKSAVLSSSHLRGTLWWCQCSVLVSWSSPPRSQSSRGCISILVSEERSFAFLQPHDVSFDFDCDNIERRTLTEEQERVR